MNKNILASIVIASVFVIGAGTLAPTASALTFDELQVQIKELLAKIADLTNQLNILQGSDSTTVTIPGSEIISDAFTLSPHRVCRLLKRNLSQGIQGDDVQSLQEFLSLEGYFSANATGYFGPITAQAVANWQTSQGVQSVGFVGPLTQARIRVWCEGGGVNSGLLRATPQSGIAPLAVSFWYVIGGATVSESDYFIEFGDGATGSVMIGCGSMGNSDACPRSLTASHTYTADGTYTAALYKTSRGGCTPEAEAQGCLGAPASQKVVGRVQIRVGTPAACTADAMQCSDGSWVGRTGPNCQFVCPGTVPNPIGCTREYVPVCGQPPEPACRNFIPACMMATPGPQTYGNRCMLNAAGATFLRSGRCEDIVACTADARQCSDGSWVGRSGPNCQFVCPTDSSDSKEAISSRLEQLRTSIKQTAKTSASNVSQCKTMAIGHALCGGPGSYVIYSTATDEQTLRSFVDQYTALQKKYQEKYMQGMAGICAITPAPTVVLKDGSCQKSGDGWGSAF